MDTNTSAETYITKLQLTDKCLYITLEWKENETVLFHIKIIDGDTSWSGIYSNESALGFYQRVNIDETAEQYSSNVKTCLMEANENYIYDFTTTGDSATFSWRRKFVGSKVLHGEVSVNRDAIPESKDSLLDILLKKNNNLKHEVKELSSKTSFLHGELEKCKDELEQYVNIKTSLETSLYGKFVQLLNTKKRRIQLLEDNLQNFEEPINITMAGD